MSHISHFIFFTMILLSWSPCHAAGWICRAYNDCEPGSNSYSGKSANPSKGNKIRLNPAAVPVEKSFGIETIAYKGQFDFALVKGLGRVGAAISPSNSEETFFGPPGFELPQTFQNRKRNKDKYKGTKWTFATAFNLYKNGKTNIKRFELNLGVMGKYNRVSKTATPGAGISGVAGPLTFGYSAYNDETQFDYSAYGLSQKPSLQYKVETMSAGIFLDSLIVDYSKLRLITNDVSTVTVLTASLLWKRAIITAAKREERSDRPAYNFDSKIIESKRVKSDIFGGLQFRITPNFMASAFYNYYLLREASFGATLFF